MNIDLKNNKKHKKIFYCSCLVIAVVLLGIRYSDFSDNISENVTQPGNAVYESAPQPPRPVAQNNGNNSLMTDAFATILLGEESSNPFVEVGDLIVDKDNPNQPVMAKKNGSSSGGLPAIPKPNLPGIPTPSGFSSPSVPVTPAAPPAVQGILSANDGSAMAIMSDGSILKEGDTYQDGRIAYIGGEGITFDNGTSILYK